MTASLLLILSAAFHAVWNFMLKRAPNKLGAGLAFMVIATSINGVYGIISAQLPILSLTLICAIVAAGIFEGIYFYLLNTAYATQALGVAYTIMRGGAMVLVWAISMIALHESITATNFVSVFTILLGIAAVQRSFSARELLASGAYAAYVCAGCIAGYHICYGLAVRAGAAPSVVFASAMTVGIATYLAFGRRRALVDLTSSFMEHPFRMVAGGLACGASFLLFVTALTLVEPGRAISLRNTSVVFGAILAALGGDKLKRVQWIGVLLVTTGALMLLL